jgi:tetratricopeptide (TPR) repeat protein
MYSAKDVAQIVGVQESRVRYWAQTGFVGPSERKGGRPMYSFQDLVGVKAAKELLDSGLTVQRVRKNLDALKAALPQIDRPLAQLRIVSDGDRLVVQDAEARFEPTTGQLVMDFGLGALEAEVKQLAQAPLPARPEREETAYAWFLEGTKLDGEAGREDEALIAYQKALDGDPLLAAAHTNLGNLLYRRGALTDARTHYDTALTLDPEQPEARYNLANLLDELGEHERAVAEWTRVAAACPEFADAHFNLAVSFFEEGSPERARVHLEKYLALDQEGEWATRARDLLDRL